MKRKIEKLDEAIKRIRKWSGQCREHQLKMDLEGGIDNSVYHNIMEACMKGVEKLEEVKRDLKEKRKLKKIDR